MSKGVTDWIVEGRIQSGLALRWHDGHGVPLTSEQLVLDDRIELRQRFQQEMAPAIRFGVRCADGTDHVAAGYLIAEEIALSISVHWNTPVRIEILSLEWAGGWNRPLFDAREIPPPKAGDLATHNADPRNRTRAQVMWGAIPLLHPGEGRVKTFRFAKVQGGLARDCVRDYLLGRDMEASLPSFAMVLYFKVAERIGKDLYRDRSRSLATKTLDRMIADLGGKLAPEEARQLRQAFIRWRHAKSEAHLLPGGQPTPGGLRLARKFAWCLVTHVGNPPRSATAAPPSADATSG